MAIENGLGTSSLTLGIIAVSLDVISLFIIWPLAIIGLLLAGTGLSLGISNRARLRTGEATNKGATTTGIVFSSIALGLSVIIVLLVVIGLAAG